jgi:hypothetical protein
VISFPNIQKSATRTRVDFGRPAREGSELLGIEEHFVNALGARVKMDLLVKKGAFLVWLFRW